MTTRVDFSVNAHIYDRRHGALLSPDTARQLADAAGLSSGSRILDIGAGTGRVSIPFAERGCAIAALEPSPPMLAELRAKAGSVSIAAVAGEASQLPFADGSFDAVVVARLMYLLADWPDALREAARVLRAGGRLLHEWANGKDDEPWVQIKEKARSLFEDAGVAMPFHPGARSEEDVDRELGRLGWTVEREISAGPGPMLTLDSFLARIVSGECS